LDRFPKAKKRKEKEMNGKTIKHSQYIFILDFWKTIQERKIMGSLNPFLIYIIYIMYLGQAQQDKFVLNVLNNKKMDIF
jgi:hypothetical protein